VLPALAWDGVSPFAPTMQSRLHALGCAVFGFLSQWTTWGSSDTWRVNSVNPVNPVRHYHREDRIFRGLSERVHNGSYRSP
jgi:hypothetical protein